MDHLLHDLEAMIKHVKTLPPNPNPEQLKSKVQALSDALTKDTIAMARYIQDIVHKGFQYMGWDSKRRIVCDRIHFDFEHLLPTLEKIRTDALSSQFPPVNPTAAELASISSACNRLWELDVNRLIPDRDYRINVQRGKRVYDEGDMAADPLFAFVDPKALQKPTYAAFVALLDNYIASLGQSEVVDDYELNENRRFLTLIMDTPVMQYVHQYLLRAGKTKASTRDQFIVELNNLWFTLYRRKSQNDSSGFEHVFVGEIKEDSNEIVGFHNWIQLYLEEKKVHFDYQGFIKPRRQSLPGRVPRACEQLISLQFRWHHAIKKVSSSFIGTSPEFEVALYTLCFFMNQQDLLVQTGPYKVQITCHRWPPNARPGQREYIATAFPSDAPWDENEVSRRGGQLPSNVPILMRTYPPILHYRQLRRFSHRFALRWQSRRHRLAKYRTALDSTCISNLFCLFFMYCIHSLH
ncbi:hypothetical protein EON65_07565 [archaeon]|nr:MAG: hypothetical protein EON65_07565 [archaeon]